MTTCVYVVSLISSTPARPGVWAGMRFVVLIALLLACEYSCACDPSRISFEASRQKWFSTPLATSVKERLQKMDLAFRAPSAPSLASPR